MVASTVAWVSCPSSALSVARDLVGDIVLRSVIVFESILPIFSIMRFCLPGTTGPAGIVDYTFLGVVPCLRLRCRFCDLRFFIWSLAASVIWPFVFPFACAASVSRRVPVFC